MTDARRVADALSALADGTAPESVEHRAVVADAVDAASDVRDAARFVAGGGRGRLRLAVRTAERVGDGDAADRGRRTLDALALFRAVAADDAGDATTTAADPDAATGPSAGTAAADTADGASVAADSVPLRSRNDFTRRRSSTARRK